MGVQTDNLQTEILYIKIMYRTMTEKYIDAQLILPSVLLAILLAKIMPCIGCVYQCKGDFVKSEGNQEVLRAVGLVYLKTKEREMMINSSSET